MRDLKAKTLAILTRAEAAGDLRTALGAIRTARGNLDLLAKLLGELRHQTDGPSRETPVELRALSDAELQRRIADLLAICFPAIHGGPAGVLRELRAENAQAAPRCRR